MNANPCRMFGVSARSPALLTCRLMKEDSAPRRGKMLGPAAGFPSAIGEVAGSASGQEQTPPRCRHSEAAISGESRSEACTAQDASSRLPRPDPSGRPATPSDGSSGTPRADPGIAFDTGPIHQAFPPPEAATTGFVSSRAGRASVGSCARTSRRLPAPGPNSWHDLSGLPRRSAPRTPPHARPLHPSPTRCQRAGLPASASLPFRAALSGSASARASGPFPSRSTSGLGKVMRGRANTARVEVMVRGLVNESAV
ncbi:hypothetical protein ABIB54_003605 [Frigoribacterium sp. UYMn621]